MRKSCGFAPFRRNSCLNGKERGMKGLPNNPRILYIPRPHLVVRPCTLNEEFILYVLKAGTSEFSIFILDKCATDAWRYTEIYSSIRTRFKIVIQRCICPGCEKIPITPMTTPVRYPFQDMPQLRCARFPFPRTLTPSAIYLGTNHLCAKKQL